MLTLIIIRHAKTNQESSTGKDFDRELMPRGILQCAELAEFLKNDIYTNTLAVVSSAKRTQQTYHLIEQSFGKMDILEGTEFYLANHQELLRIFWNFKHKKNVILIGHNYGISDLASYVTNEMIDLGTSELIKIELPIDDWSELSNGHGTIAARFRPQA